MGAMPGMDHGESVASDVTAQLTSAGYSENGQAGTWDFMGSAPAGAPTIDGPAFSAAAIANVVARGWSNLDRAKADGYSQPTRYTDQLHWWNEDFVNDGITSDPTRPESLVFDPRNGKFLAAMWLMPIGEHGAPISGVAESDGRWHVHPGQLCYLADRMIPRDQVSRDGTCPVGMTSAMWSAEMMHTWVAGDKTFTSKMPDEAAAALGEANKQPSSK